MTDLRVTVIGKNMSGLFWIIIIPNIADCCLNRISVIFSVPLCENLIFQGHAFLGHHLAEGLNFFFRMITELRGDPYTQLQLFRSKKPANSHVTISSSFNSRADCQLPHLSALVQASK